MAKRYLLMAFLFVFFRCYLTAQPVLNRLYSSGIYNGNQVDILVNGPLGTSAIGIAEGEGFTTYLSNAWNSDIWLQGTITNPTSGYMGFWYPYPTYTVNPMYHPGTQDPELSYYAGLGTDGIGDNIYPSSPWLDIMAIKGSFSSDRIYFAIYTGYGSYPVSSGSTFFAYMPILVDPEADPEDDPIVFGLMYTVSVPGVIGPGLYKITGAGFSGLTRIGDIVTSVQDYYLLLSCSFSDLMADPDFSSWYDPADPRVAMVATTSRISLVEGIQQADTSLGLDLLLRPQAVPIQNLSAPVLSHPSLIANQDNIFIPQITYYDSDGNFPSIASFSIDGGDEHPLYPADYDNLDFHVAVPYRGQGIPQPANWSVLRFRFTHGDEFVYLDVPNGSATPDDEGVPGLSLDLYPNPVRNTVNIKLNARESLPLYVYNLKGQIIDELHLDANVTNLHDISHYPAGIYMLKAKNHGNYIKRFIKM